jgi:acyl carrier protein
MCAAKGLFMTEPRSPGTDVEALFGSLKELLDDINDGAEGPEVTLETRLVDLGLESISLVYLTAELQQMYGLGDAMFRQMRSEGTFIKDMSVGDIINSLHALIGASGKAA